LALSAVRGVDVTGGWRRPDTAEVRGGRGEARLEGKGIAFDRTSCEVEVR
jgi:hypothetical protein